MHPDRRKNSDIARFQLTETEIPAVDSRHNVPKIEDVRACVAISLDLKVSTVDVVDLGTTIQQTASRMSVTFEACLYDRQVRV